MASKKKSGNQSEVRAAWARVRQALNRAESAMAALVNANTALLRALGKAGASVTHNARTDLNARIRKLDRNRKNARKQLNTLASRLMSLAKRPSAKARPKAKRK